MSTSSDPCRDGNCPTCDADPAATGGLYTGGPVPIGDGCVMPSTADLIAIRQEHYGDPRPNHDRIAGLWGAYLDVTLTAHDVAVMMVLLKCARSKVDPWHEDNYDDGKAYLDIARRVR
jgi:hypothetical protein